MKQNVLILCTGNSARSILTEAYFNHIAADKWQAFSAGSKPTGKVHPVALELLADHGLKLENPHSKSWDEFADHKAPKMDLVITVCDNAANETCPVWPGAPKTYHWPFPDPAATPLTDPKIRDDFEHVFILIKKQVDEFLKTNE